MRVTRGALKGVATALALAGTSLALAQGLPAISVGAPAEALSLRAVAGLPLTIAEAGEYQIDALGGPRDAQLLVSSNGEVIAADDDSGEGTDARIIAFLAAGSYEVHVTERGGRAMTARVTAAEAPARVALRSVTPGAGLITVEVPAGASPREASVDVTLTIATAGRYRIDVAAAHALDAEVELISGRALLQADSSSGGLTNAQIIRELAPGEYTLRVRDAENRAGPLTINVFTE